MIKSKKASISKNPIEFKVGDKVIQIFPVARPLIGIITGINKVEGKVYVNWNGRNIQVDPEDIQLAEGIPFYPISRTASQKDNEKHLLKIINSLKNVRKSFKTANLFFDFENELIKNGFEKEESNKIASNYKYGLNQRLKANEIDPLEPITGELVVILNEDGSKAGMIGVLIDIDNTDAIVDLTSGWSPSGVGSRLIKTPLISVIPINNNIRMVSENRYGSLCCELEYIENPSIRSLENALSLMLDENKIINVFNVDNFKSYIELNFNAELKELTVTTIVEHYNPEERITERGPIFYQKLGGLDIQDETDFENAIRRIHTLISNCKSVVLQHFRDFIVPKYVEKELQREVKEESKIASVIIHDLNNDSKYQINSPDEAKNKVDKSVAEEAFNKKETISMGKVVAEYINDNKKANKESSAKERYNAFFNEKLKKYNVKSPKELNEKEKIEFFNEIEKEWIAKGESGKRYVEDK